jgi:hypothetical protein
MNQPSQLKVTCMLEQSLITVFGRLLGSPARTPLVTRMLRIVVRSSVSFVARRCVGGEEELRPCDMCALVSSGVNTTFPVLGNVC